MLERALFREKALLWACFDFPQCSFQYPTINICASLHYFNKYLWSKIVSGIFAWDWKANFRGLKFTQDAYITRIKLNFWFSSLSKICIPVWVYQQQQIQVVFVLDLNSSLDLKNKIRWFWGNRRNLGAASAALVVGQWISNRQPELFSENNNHRRKKLSVWRDLVWFGLQKLSVALFGLTVHNNSSTWYWQYKSNHNYQIRGLRWNTNGKNLQSTVTENTPFTSLKSIWFANPA